jgi:hypothetical protein
MERGQVMSDKEAESAARSNTIHAVIDRIEDNDMAVILLGDDEQAQIDMPVSFLPAEATEGDHLSITIKLDDDARDAMTDKIRKLQEELLNRSNSKG